MMVAVGQLAGLRLLVVEDEAMVAMMLEDMLADLGCIVVDVAGSLAHGLALVESLDIAIDGAVLDINLGGEKVYPVAERLEARQVPFIFSTGYGLAGISPQYAHVLALAKPFSLPRLERALLSAVARPQR